MSLKCWLSCTGTPPTPPGGSSPVAGNRVATIVEGSDEGSSHRSPAFGSSEEGSTHRSPAFGGGDKAPFGRAPVPAAEVAQGGAVVEAPETQVCLGSVTQCTEI